MPVFTAQSPSFRQSVQEQLLDISKQPVLEYRLQSCSMRMTQQSSDSISQECRTDSGTHFPSGIISLRSFSSFRVNCVNCQISREKI